jgi:hypothetical protein
MPSTSSLSLPFDTLGTLDDECERRSVPDGGCIVLSLIERALAAPAQPDMGSAGHNGVVGEDILDGECVLAYEDLCCAADGPGSPRNNGNGLCSGDAEGVPIATV